jgi:Outer membrane protein beta-barrel domain
MRFNSRSVALLAFLSGLGAGLPACWAQKWEVGALGGGSFYMDASVSSPSGSGNAGIKPGMAAGAFVGNNLNKNFGGELRYEYLTGDLKVSGNGGEATFAGNSQAIHYDMLFHFAPTEARVRPFVSAGGGVKIYSGTGNPTVTQPASNLALLTNTHQTAGLGVFGGGFKAAISKNISLRVEVKDFLSPFPKQVIAPAPGAKIGSILNEIVVMAGLGIAF